MIQQQKFSTPLNLAVAAFLLTLLVQTAHAQTTWNAGNGNWDTDANWTSGEPVSGQAATINNGSTVTVDQAGEIAGSVTVSGASVLTVATLGVLTLDSDGAKAFSIGSGTLSITGGSVTANVLVNDFLGNGGAGSMNISAGSFSRTTGNTRLGDNSGTGIIDVSGSGTYSGGALVPGVTAAGAGVINLTGSSASIDSLSSIVATSAGDTTFNLNPGAGGIDVIDMTNDLNLSGAGTETLNFDTVNFRGAKSVPIFSYGGSLTGTFDSVSIFDSMLGSLTLGSDPLGDPNNLADGEYFLDYGDGTGDDVTLLYNIVIPEPSTFALSALGLLSLGLAGWRRKRLRM